jgi:hypothetical protein
MPKSSPVGNRRFLDYKCVYATRIDLLSARPPRIPLLAVLWIRVGHGYETIKSRQLFRDFIDATALINIGDDAISVRYQKRAHDPLLVAAGFDEINARIPRLGNEALRLSFG